MNKKKDIAFDWLRRYTGTNPNDYGDWILLTNFHNYVEKFSERFDSKINGIGGPMTSSINKDGLGIINFGIGSANAATIMDLLSSIKPKGILFLGKCGGLKKTTDIGNFILPIAAIRSKKLLILGILFYLLLLYAVKVPVTIIFQKKFLQCHRSNYINMFLES